MHHGAGLETPELLLVSKAPKLMDDMVRATVELAHDLPWVAFDGGSAQWAFDVDELRIEYCRAGWE